MRFGMVALALCLSLSCAAHSPPNLPVAERPNLDGVMQVIGRFSFAHACPCDGFVLTAAHVAHPLYLQPGYQHAQIAYSWSDDRGGEGYLTSEYLLLSRDIGFMRVDSGSPAFYRHATEAPRAGETLRWKEYDFSSLEKAFAPVEREGKLLRRVAGHLVLDHMPQGGGSGSCVINERNEVVAVNAFSHRIGAGLVVSIYGKWWPGELMK